MKSKHGFDEFVPPDEFVGPPNEVITPLGMTPVRAATGVYFIKGADVVKIGVALCVRDRLRVLQVGSPVPLTPLGFIRCDFRKSFAKERELHALFAALRKHNEWFSDSPDLRAYIRDNAEPWPE